MILLSIQWLTKVSYLNAYHRKPLCIYCMCYRKYFVSTVTRYDRHDYIGQI